MHHLESRGSPSLLFSAAANPHGARHPFSFLQPQILTDVLETTNYIFVSIFALEMLITVVGLGPTGYLSQGQNVFDGVIVIVRFVFVLLFV